MKRDLEHDIDDWLRAEESGPDDLAERALRRALRDMGRRAPAPGFTDRVLLAAGRLTPLPTPWRSWWLRFPVAACLLAAGIAAAMLPAWLLVVAPFTHAFGGPLLAASWHWLGRWVAAAFASWRIVEDVVTALRLSLTTPTALAVLSANAVLAVASLLALKRLLNAPEEFTTC